MNSYSLFSLVGLVLGLIFLTQSCPPPRETSKTQHFSEDCYPDRKTVSGITRVTGRILKVGSIYAIALIDDDSRRYGPCNLTEQWQEEGKVVIFSGDVKEIRPNERWPATPFVLTMIGEKK